LTILTVRFGEFTAVKDATLDIKGASSSRFLRPSGCGKTTILRTIFGFLDRPKAQSASAARHDGIGRTSGPTLSSFQNLAFSR